MHFVQKQIKKSRFLVGCLGLLWVAFTTNCGSSGTSGELASPPPEGAGAPPPPEEDPSVLKVLATAPTSGEANANRDQKVAIQFNQGLDLSTMNSSNIKIKSPSGEAVPGSFSFDQENKVALFTPSIQFESGMTYHLEVSTGLKSATGVSMSNTFEMNFTTGADAPSTPSVDSMVPPDGSVNIATNQEINIHFDCPEGIDSSTVNSNHVRLKNRGGQPVPASVSFDQANNMAIITPHASLESESTYHVEINGVRSLANIELANNFEFVFSTGAAPQEAPEVVSSTPAAGAVNVNVDQNIEIRFDQAMDLSTMNTNNIQLRNAQGDAVAINVSLDETHRILLIHPAANLEANSGFHLALSTNVQSELHLSLEHAFELSFSTKEEEEEPMAPTVIATNPADGAIDVALSQAISIQFSRAMDVTTLVVANVQLQREEDGQAVPTTLSYNAETNTLLVTPNVSLESSTAYRLNLTTDVRSQDQVALGDLFQLFFNTGEAEVVAPRILSTSPSEGASDVALGAQLEIRFDQEMDLATMSETNILLQKTSGGEAVGVPAAFSLDETNRILRVDPISDLEVDANYQLQIGTGVQSAAGLGLAEAFNLSFSTVEEEGEEESPAPSIVATNPAEDAVDVALNHVIRIAFSGNIDVSTINTTNIKLHLVSDGSEVPATVTWDSDLNMAFLTPSSSLTASTAYHLQVTTGVRNTDSVAMEDDLGIQFTTAPQ